MDELVSIIIPVYCAEEYIKDTLESVRKQTYSNWELLLVADGEQDSTIPVIEEYIQKTEEGRIRLFVQKQNQGAALARNRGVREAGGRFIAYLDADDLWDAEKLEKELAFMQKKDAAFAFTGYEFGDEQAVGTGKIVRVPEKLVYKEALKNTTIFTSTVMFDTSKISKEMLEMPNMKSEDTALWWKILRNGYDAYGLDENLVTYRRPQQSLSSNKLVAIRRIWDLYRKAEGLSIPYSCYNFCFWAIKAVWRRV
ncbi:MAG: glycosyltransferase family 2 protein [Lachnospiraceae bacterium]|nr:glycosyltransferase family 2 protein [Lachnospiraceae bacterium]